MRSVLDAATLELRSEVDVIVI